MSLDDEVKKLALKREELKLLKAKKHYEAELPHVYRRHYKWSRLFHDSDNRMNFVSAANQIGKSSAAIRRTIDDCTNPERWKKLWPQLKGDYPKQIWYFYPDHETLKREFDTKWIEWLPSGSQEISEKYGWKAIRTTREVKGVKFNAGPTIYFFTYSMDVKAVQASTVFEVTADEEMPMKFYDELVLRLTRTRGILNAVFTPTLNQPFWKEVMEGEKLPTAFKQQVSMFDCLTYDNGDETDFTEKSIQDVIAKCKSETEVQRRVYGKFITEEGRVYYAYESSRHFVSRQSTSGYQVYAAVDGGSGGKNHPAAITFIAAKKDLSSGFVVCAWRGDGIETTAGDLLNKYNELAKPYHVVQKCYDPASVDFGLLAGRTGAGFTKANKAREYGEETVNTLFKYDMLQIFDDSEDLNKLSIELSHLMSVQQKSSNKKNDDLCDSLRYNVMQIPWNWEGIDSYAIESLNAKTEKTNKPKTEADLVAEQMNLRRGLNADGTDQKSDEDWTIEEELNFWNEQADY